MSDNYYFLKLLYYRIYKGSDIMYFYYNGKTFVSCLQDFIMNVSDSDLVCVMSWLLMDTPIVAFENICGLFGFKKEDFFDE